MGSYHCRSNHRPERRWQDIALELVTDAGEMAALVVSFSLALRMLFPS